MAGVSDFKDLGAWKLAYDLKLHVVEICNKTSFQCDERLCGQLLDAARSGPRNIAEGFGRWNHRDFARFARIAKASEIELLNQFQEACDSGHITRGEQARLEHSARKALKAVSGLIRYLEKTPDVK